MNDCPHTRPSNHFRTYVHATPRAARQLPKEWERPATKKSDFWPELIAALALFVSIASFAVWAFSQPGW